MLIATKIQDLNFFKLMEVYIEGNEENGREQYPNHSAYEQLRLAESDFYHYLADDFFKQTEAIYFVLTEADKYISALRVEPYRDGMLLQALETRPDMRRLGFAKMLLSDVLQYLRDNGHKKIYSHISKRNLPSIKIHKACGFDEILDYAEYIDGTVSSGAVTMCAQI